MELTVTVICEGFPGPTSAGGKASASVACDELYLGLQHGEDVIAVVAAGGKPVTFAPDFRIAERAGGKANFLGPYAKGTPEKRFFYLVWLCRSGGSQLTRYGRAKVHLSHLPWSVVERAAASGAPLTVRLSMTDGRGGPRCGSVPDADARWQLVP